MLLVFELKQNWYKTNGKIYSHMTVYFCKCKILGFSGEKKGIWNILVNFADGK